MKERSSLTTGAVKWGSVIRRVRPSRKSKESMLRKTGDMDARITECARNSPPTASISTSVNVPCCNSSPNARETDTAVDPADGLLGTAPFSTGWMDNSHATRRAPRCSQPFEGVRISSTETSFHHHPLNCPFLIIHASSLFFLVFVKLLSVLTSCIVALTLHVACVPQSTRQRLMARFEAPFTTSWSPHWNETTRPNRCSSTRRKSLETISRMLGLFVTHGLSGGLLSIFSAC
mmetsp:Transcript_54751/g.151871  ORF Transcript_54751/g.151871 Transcript_54751/m.151871 type:complete len:233 (-) Transcript_54751:119-817(-)